MAEKNIFLCFRSFSDSKRCWRSTGPLDFFSEITLSNHDHHSTRTICSESEYFLCLVSNSILGVLVAVGSQKNMKGEKYENGIWSDFQDPPKYMGGTKFFHYAGIFYAGNFYYFGGSTWTYASRDSILCLNAANWTWSKVGRLRSTRTGHGVILVGKTFMIIGGSYNQPIEACVFNNGKFTCEEKNTSLNNYYAYPILFLVNDTFCSNQ